MTPKPSITFKDFQITTLKTPISISSTKLPNEDLNSLVQLIKLTTNIDILEPSLSPYKTVSFSLKNPSEYDSLLDSPMRISNQNISFSMLKENSQVFIVDVCDGTPLVMGSYDVYLKSDFDDVNIIDDALVEFEVDNLQFKLKGKEATCSKFNKGLTIIYTLNQIGISSSQLKDALSSTIEESFQIYPLDETNGFISFKSKSVKNSVLKRNEMEIVCKNPLNSNSIANIQTVDLKKSKKLESKGSKHQTSNHPGEINTKSNPKDKTSKKNSESASTKERSKYVVTCCIPKHISIKDLKKVLNGFKPEFITIRSKIAYVELNKQSHENILSQKLESETGFKFEFKDFNSDHIPYIKVYLFPIKEGIALWQVNNAVEKVIHNSIGKVRTEKQHYVIRVSSIEDRNQLLKVQTLSIKPDKSAGSGKNFKVGSTVWAFENEDQIRKMSTRSLDISELKKNLLDRDGKKEILGNLEKEFNVFTTIEKNGAQSTIKISTPMNNINDALIQLQNRLKEFKELNLSFKVDLDFKKKMLHEMLKSTLEVKSNFEFNIFDRMGIDYSIIEVSICGSLNEVGEAEQKLKDIVFEESDLPKKLALIPEEVKKEFSVLINMDEKMTVCGMKSDVSNFKQWINSNLKKDWREEIKMSEAELFFYKQMIKKDFHEIVVTETKHGIILNGDEKKIKEATVYIQNFKKNIQTFTFKKSLVSTLLIEIGPFLKDFFKDDFVYTHYVKPNNFRKRRSTKSKSNSDSSDSSDDESSSDEYSGDEEIFKEEFSSVTFNISIHNERLSEKLNQKIKQITEMNEGKSQQIRSIDFDEQRFILKHFGDKYGSRIKVLKRQKMVVIQGLWSKDVSNLYKEIQVKRESFSMLETQKIDSDYIFSFLTTNNKRLLKIQDMFGIKLKYDKSKSTIIYKGKSNDIKKSKDFIKDIIKNLKKETFQIKPLILSSQDLNQLRQI